MFSPDRVRKTVSKILSSIKEARELEQTHKRAERFVNLQFERLLREEITYPYVVKIISDEAQKPSVLNINPQMLFSSYNRRRIAYVLYRE